MFYLIKEGLGKSGPCRVYNSDARVKVGKKRYVYPDVTVSCDVSDHRRDNDILHSPHLVVEVLSPSTESIDRVKKLQWYTQHPCIEEYVLVNTRVQRVELYRRKPAGEDYTWHNYCWSAGEEIELDSLDLRIPVDELYADLRIPLPGEDEPEE
jgi:Uma2 family endonuclease